IDAVELPAWLQNHDRATEAHRKGDLRERSPAPADGDHGVSRRGHGKVPRVPEAGDDGVVDPLVPICAALARKNPDRGSPGRLRATCSRGHDLSQSSGHNGAPSLSEQAPNLLGPRLV